MHPLTQKHPQQQTHPQQQAHPLLAPTAFFASAASCLRLATWRSSDRRNSLVLKPLSQT
jgi:hypothetical protein